MVDVLVAVFVAHVEIQACTVHAYVECEILIEIFPYFSLHSLICFYLKSMDILCI